MPDTRQRRLPTLRFLRILHGAAEGMPVEHRQRTQAPGRVLKGPTCVPGYTPYPRALMLGNAPATLKTLSCYHSALHLIHQRLP
jgi:hypothetical protein